MTLGHLIVNSVFLTLILRLLHWYAVHRAKYLVNLELSSVTPYLSAKPDSVKQIHTIICQPSIMGHGIGTTQKEAVKSYGNPIRLSLESLTSDFLGHRRLPWDQGIASAIGKFMGHTGRPQNRKNPGEKGEH